MKTRNFVSFALCLALLTINAACAMMGGNGASSEDLLAAGGPWPHGESCSSQGRKTSRKDTTQPGAPYIHFVCTKVGENLKFVYIPPKDPKLEQDNKPAEKDTPPPFGSTVSNSSGEVADDEMDEEPGMAASKIMYRCKTQGNCTKADFAKFYELVKLGGYTIEGLDFDPKEVKALEAKAPAAGKADPPKSGHPITAWAQQVVATCLKDETACNRTDLQRMLDWRDKKVPEVMAVDIQGPALERLRSILAPPPTASEPDDR